MRRINNEASVGGEKNEAAKKKAGRKNPTIFPRGPFSNLRSYTFLQFPREPLMYFFAAFLLMFMAVVHKWCVRPIAPSYLRLRKILEKYSRWQSRSTRYWPPWKIRHEKVLGNSSREFEKRKKREKKKKQNHALSNSNFALLSR